VNLMAYTQMENLGGSGQDRQFSIFTTANIAGGGMGAALFWWVGKLALGGDIFSVEWFIRMGLIGVGVGLGLLLTMYVKGMTLHQRITLIGLYYTRKAAGNHLVQPDQGLSTRRSTGHGVVIYREGTDHAILRPYEPGEEEVGYA
jgi:hypothetical protein